MTRHRSRRDIANMKYLLYKKVYSRASIPALSQMTSAGVKATLPQALENVQVPPGINTNYGVAIAQIINALLQSLIGLQNSLNFGTMNLISSNPLTTITPTQTTITALLSVLTYYDRYVENCQILYQPAVFDETYFDLSVYQPPDGQITINSGCERIEKIISQLTSTQQYIPLNQLGYTSTSNPEVDSFLFSLISNSGLSGLVNDSLEDFLRLPDLAKYVLSYIALLNNIIDSGFALDVAWLDRSVLAPESSGVTQLNDGITLQYFAQAIGVILDVTPLDLVPLIPDYYSSYRDVAILTADKTVIEVFATIFFNHLVDPSPGGVIIGQSLPAETYAETFSQFLLVKDAVMRKYSNVWKARMVLSAIMEYARYPYKMNLTYASGERTLSFQDFYNYWYTKWKLYGLTDEDLAYAQQLGSLLQKSAGVQNELKKSVKEAYLKTWKPIFYYKNFKSIAQR